MVQTWFTMCNSTEINTIINTDTGFYLAHNLYSKILLKCSQLKKKKALPFPKYVEHGYTDRFTWKI